MALIGFAACNTQTTEKAPPVEYAKQKTTYRLTLQHTGLAMIAPVFAQVTVPAETDAVIAPATDFKLPPELDTFVTRAIVNLAGKYPIAAQVLGWLVAFVGFMRLWAKPIFSGLHAIADLTPSKWDDSVLGRFRNWLLSPGGAWLHWVLDYLCSIKIVPPKAVAEVKQAAETQPYQNQPSGPLS